MLLAPLALVSCSLDPSGTATNGQPTTGSGSATTGTASGGMGGMGAGGAGGAGGVSVGTSSGGGGGGAPLVEDCFNDTDDDNDGSPDCADPDCAAQYSCVPEALMPTFVQEEMNCQDPFVDLDLLDCSKCACQDVSGGCTATGAFYNMPNCTGQTGDSFTATSLMCDQSNANNGPNDLYAMVSVTAMQNGTCTPSEANTPHSVCQLDAGSVCTANGNACAPVREGATCVIIDGSMCPPGYPSSRPVRLPPGICGCSCMKDEMCPDEIRAYPGAACLVDVSVVPLNGCTDTNLTMVTSVRAPSSVVTCTPTSASPIDLRTLCCAM
jgi:hypothetical protein